MIYKRRSVRKYRQDRIPQGDILKMIEAAKVAPSAKTGNRGSLSSIQAMIRKRY